MCLTNYGIIFANVDMKNEEIPVWNGHMFYKVVYCLLVYVETNRI